MQRPSLIFKALILLIFTPRAFASVLVMSSCSQSLNRSELALRIGSSTLPLDITEIQSRAVEMAIHHPGMRLRDIARQTSVEELRPRVELLAQTSDAEVQNKVQEILKAPLTYASYLEAIESYHLGYEVDPWRGIFPFALLMIEDGLVPFERMNDIYGAFMFPLSKVRGSARAHGRERDERWILEHDLGHANNYISLVYQPITFLELKASDIDWGAFLASREKFNKLRAKWHAYNENKSERIPRLSEMLFHYLHHEAALSSIELYAHFGTSILGMKQGFIEWLRLEKLVSEAHEPILPMAAEAAIQNIRRFYESLSGEEIP